MNGSRIHTKEGLLEVINALPLAVTVIDRNRKIVLANKMTLMFVNKREQEMIGHVGGEAFGCAHCEDVPDGCGFGPVCLRCRLRETVSDTMKSKRPSSPVEATMCFRRIGKRDLRISALPMSLSNEDVVLLSIEDITEAKLHEQIRTENEKLAAVIETAGAICHELNQPLMSALGFSELMLMNLNEGHSAYTYANHIKAQVERMGNITQNLRKITTYKTKAYLDKRIIDLDEAARG